ncbi:MAG TPA: hypothetical protein VE572_06475 [Nitrososphaeraceae archaeon]|jgi:hypothetical protein|nr:hypothetical protein [Nitrososphaeraceae archaeon]
MNKNTIWTLAYLMAGTLLTVAATSMVPVAYAGEDGDGNKVKAEDHSQVGITDCDDNELTSGDNTNNDFSSFENLDCEVLLNFP